MLKLKACLKRLKAWIVNDPDMGEQELVNEDTDDDDEFFKETSQTRKRMRKRPKDEDTRLRKEDSREEITEKFNYLKESFNKMKDSITRLEFEVDCLRDEKVEIEEESKLQRGELLKLIEFTKVLKVEKEGDKNTIKIQQEIIKKISLGNRQEETFEG